MKHSDYLTCTHCLERYDVEFDVDPGDASVGLRGAVVDAVDLPDPMPCGCLPPDEHEAMEALNRCGAADEAMQSALEARADELLERWKEEY